MCNRCHLSRVAHQRLTPVSRKEDEDEGCKFKKKSPWKKLISDPEFQISDCPSSYWHETTGIDGVWDSHVHLVFFDFNRLMNQNVLIKLASCHCSLEYQSGAAQSRVWWDSVFNGFKKEGLLDPWLRHGLFSLFKHLDLDQLVLHFFYFLRSWLHRRILGELVSLPRLQWEVEAWNVMTEVAVDDWI